MESARGGPSRGRPARYGRRTSCSVLLVHDFGSSIDYPPSTDLPLYDPLKKLETRCPRHIITQCEQGRQSECEPTTHHSPHSPQKPRQQALNTATSLSLSLNAPGECPCLGQARAGLTVHPQPRRAHRSTETTATSVTSTRTVSEDHQLTDDDDYQLTNDDKDR